MIFIFGGAFQGKKKYALDNFNVTQNDFFKSDELYDIFNSKIIADYHLIIKKMMHQDIDPIEFTRKLCAENSDAVIIMNEIGCGIIPMDKSEREWRENVGRCGCILSEKAEKVIRVICGIPIVLKEQK